MDMTTPRRATTPGRGTTRQHGATPHWTAPHSAKLRCAALLGALLACGATAARAQAPVAEPAPAPAVLAAAQAQQAAPEAITTTPCGTAAAAPSALPPPGAPPFIWILELCFDRQGGSSTVENETYMYYIKLRPSQPSRGLFVPYDEAAEQVMIADHRGLWATNFLEDLSIESDDYTFPNGVVGKIITYRMEERERIKIVDYEGSKQVERAKIEEQLRERNIEVRLDSFLDEGVIRRVKGVVRTMMAEKGFTNAEVAHKVTPVAGGPKLVNVTFTISEGPKIKIRKVDFLGNQAVGDGTLQRKLKENKPKGILSFITGGGTYKEAEFEADAEKVVEYYQNRGYVRARVGQPELKVIENTKDGKTRWVELRVPVTEGSRYRVGDLGFAGNKLVTSDQLRPLFKLTAGEWYSRKQLDDGRKKAQEIYGGAGYMEFTAFPDMKPSDEPGAEEALAALVPEALAPPPEPAQGPAKEPTVDITMRVEEGPQYFVNRIVFTGNTTTRDNVIRREMRLVEGGVFNTEALKYSVRRLNQLGYFKNLEGNDKDMNVEKTVGKPNAVDVTLKFEEQNRNQLTFGAGVSQYEGVFGQLAFQTSNFLGRGESLTVSLTGGNRSQNYQLAFSEPFLFDRNITGGFDIYKRSLQYIGYYTQRSTGGNLVFGFPVADFSRMFVNYAYETVQMADLTEALLDSSCLSRPTGCAIIPSLSDLSQLTATQVEQLRRNPFLYDSLLLGQGGQRSISKIQPSFVHNTVDNPIFPSTGKRLTASLDLAVLGGNTQFYKPRMEGVLFLRHTARTSLGFRAQAEYITPVGRTTSLPIFERLFLGGEYSVRGFDIRSIGPTVPGSQIVLGGNKSLLFNAEYMFSIASQVRLVAFYDTGQVRDFGQSFGWKEDIIEIVPPEVPVLVDPFVQQGLLVSPGSTDLQTRIAGRASAFKTSTGIELRFFMPVLNVPFRLIYSFNPQRAGVLDNNLRPARETKFRFAVGTTF
jgi:outer membrane protein insertion porin family